LDEFVWTDGDRGRAAHFGSAAVRLRRSNCLRSRTKEPSAAVRTDGPSVGRSAQSELDRRAIHVVGHLLMTGVWLERRLRNAPAPWTGVVGRSGWVPSPQRRPRSLHLPSTQPAREQPSRTADFTVVSR
jgi:hypothetical protein